MQVTYKDQIGANGKVRNALADTDLAIVPGWGFLTIYGRCDAGGGAVECSLSQGQTEHAIETPVTQNASLTPNRQDDIIAGPIPCVPGKSLRSKLEETAGVAITPRIIYDFVEADVGVVIQALGGSL